MRLLFPILLAGCCPMTAMADEGMWLFSAPPREHLKSKYGFELTDAWLDHARLASVRFNSGGSGSFVSGDGLIVTNHHIGADALQKLSPANADYLRDGFFARKRADEPKCPDLELNVLQSVEDVTEQVNAAVKPDMAPAVAFAARRARMSEIEKESLGRTGLRSDVVTLYHGGQYHLYRYKKFTDVRLVFAPEAGIAAFGGDVDNFEFPRFGFDVCFFRAYEDGQPVKPGHWLRWSKVGPADGDLVFVTGHPGTTNRLETYAKLLHRRDRTLPYMLARLRSAEAALAQYSERGPDERKMAANDLHRVANARKAFAGQYQGLLDPAVMAGKKSDEQKLISLSAHATTAAVSENTPNSLPSSIKSIAAAQEKLAAFENEYYLIETGHGFFSELFTIARRLVRLGDELAKPSANRLREYRDSNLDSLKLSLFSPAPIYPELERVKLAQSLTFLAEQLGGGHPLVEKVLAGRNPTQRADELVAGCTLQDVAARRTLFDGGAAAIAGSKDTMIQLARSIDESARAVRLKHETEIEEVERQGYAAISRARFAAFGSAVAPDATFTLRLAFGVVKGYDEDGKPIPYRTTFGGAFEKADRLGHRDPFALPQRWLDGKTKLDLSTPFNFVSTADTIGGNSGSPVLNRVGELVGINFDRNRHGLVRNFVYTELRARHVAVHSRSVIEALPKLYGAASIVEELTK